jgi:hypothetical protein
MQSCRWYQSERNKMSGKFSREPEAIRIKLTPISRPHTETGPGTVLRCSRQNHGGRKTRRRASAARPPIHSALAWQWRSSGAYSTALVISQWSKHRVCACRLPTIYRNTRWRFTGGPQHPPRALFPAPRASVSVAVVCVHPSVRQSRLLSHHPGRDLGNNRVTPGRLT